MSAPAPSDDRTWAMRGTCAQPGAPDIWESESKVDRVTARHVCRWHCPVLAECQRDAARFAGTSQAYCSVVVAGVVLNGLGNSVDLIGIYPDCWICRAHATDVPDPTALRKRGAGDEHGTVTAIHRHLANGETLCSDCKTAKAYRQEQLRQRREARRDAKRREKEEAGQ